MTCNLDSRYNEFDDIVANFHFLDPIHSMLGLKKGLSLKGLSVYYDFTALLDLGVDCELLQCAALVNISLRISSIMKDAACLVFKYLYFVSCDLYDGIILYLILKVFWW